MSVVSVGRRVMCCLWYQLMIFHDACRWLCVSMMWGMCPLTTYIGLIHYNVMVTTPISWPQQICFRNYIVKWDIVNDHFVCGPRYSVNLLLFIYQERSMHVITDKHSFDRVLDNFDIFGLPPGGHQVQTWLQNIPYICFQFAVTIRHRASTREHGGLCFPQAKRLVWSSATEIWTVPTAPR